jgi:hypothetical protein
VIAARFGITAPYWAGFVVAVLVSASTWRVFNRAAVAEAYAEPALSGTAQPEFGRRPVTGLRCQYRWEALVRPKPGAQAAAPGLRASRADRERVIDLLKAAFVQGRLARDEFDTRVGQALASRTYAELAVVTADIPAALIEAVPRRLPARTRGRVSLNTAVTGGACVGLAANAGMVAALLLGSPLGVLVVGVFTVIGVILAIGAMIVSS